MRPLDVAVIGAGIVGASVAGQLAARGARVTVFERDGIGTGASGRNAGSLIYPLDPRLRPFYRDSLAVIEQLTDAGSSAAPQRAGILMLTEDADEAHAVTDVLGETCPDLEPEYCEPGDVTAMEPAVSQRMAACRSHVAHCVDLWR